LGARRYVGAGWAAVLALAGGAAIPAPPPAVGPAPRFPEERFESAVRPVLLAQCVPCHGPARSEAGLRLDRAPGAKWGPRIAQAVRGAGPVAMPPTGRLSSDRIDALAAWGGAGAPWPAAAVRTRPGTTHWALLPVARPRPPRLADSSGSLQPIDAFVRASQRRAGLVPAPEADRRTLIRRATWELTGLLPSRAEVDDFLADRSPVAFERVVDRLLASPAYAEREARHWLDLVRYADTKGYIYTGEPRYPFAWTYRDWVIGALNRDMPYDRFLRMQIAADLLPRDSDADLAALGFFTVGRRFVNNVPDVMPAATTTSSTRFPNRITTPWRASSFPPKRCTERSGLRRRTIRRPSWNSPRVPECRRGRRRRRCSER